MFLLYQRCLTKSVSRLQGVNIIFEFHATILAMSIIFANCRKSVEAGIFGIGKFYRRELAHRRQRINSEC